MPEESIKVHDTVLYDECDIVGQVERVWRDRTGQVYMVEVKPIVPASLFFRRRKLMVHEIKRVL